MTVSRFDNGSSPRHCHHLLFVQEGVVSSLLQSTVEVSFTASSTALKTVLYCVWNTLLSGSCFPRVLHVFFCVILKSYRLKPGKHWPDVYNLIAATELKSVDQLSLFTHFDYFHTRISHPFAVICTRSSEPSSNIDVNHSNVRLLSTYNIQSNLKPSDGDANQ